MTPSSYSILLSYIYISEHTENYNTIWNVPGGPVVKNLPVNVGTRVRTLIQEDLTWSN